MLPDFEMLLPATLEDALKSMAAKPAVPVAGGTNVIVDLRNGRHTPDSIVNIQNLKELGGIRFENGWITLGGAVTLAEIEKSPLIAQYGHCLLQSALIFANPLIRNRATVGGNLADASPAADTATPLLALGASLVLSSSTGSRTVDLDDFFVHVRKTLIKPGELISAIRWQVPTGKSTNGFYKLGLRKADAISVVSAAVMVEAIDDTISMVRIALGSVAPTPIRAMKVEQVLTGQKPSEKLIQSIIQLVEDTTSPISDVRATAEYRREMAGVLVARLLRQAFADLWKKES